MLSSRCLAVNPHPFKNNPVENMNISTSFVQVIARQSRIAARQLSSTTESIRNLALSKMADSLESVKHQVLEINAQEVMKARQDGQSEAMVKRLTIDDKVFQYMLSRLRKVAQRPDPLNRVLEGHTNPAGLQVYKKSVPLGVIGIIYESRPNVTTDAAGVCIKSGKTV
jgi:glutamate-5-semialdehyde dehydrogenase